MTGDAPDADLFRMTVSEYARHPANGRLHEGATGQATAANTSCGDSVALRVTVAHAVVTQVSYDARGCAICSAAAAMLCEYVAGRRLAEVESLPDRFTVAVRQAQSAPWPTELETFAVFGVLRDNPARRRCATLAFEALHGALENDRA